MMRIPDCKFFNGYKPCEPGKNCIESCSDISPLGTKILIISLEAMGTVLMTTTQLPAIKRKYPESTIYWITLKNAIHLLDDNPFIDKVLEWNWESLLVLKEIEFDVILNVDKSQKACAFANSLSSKEKLGFGLNHNGAIVPFNQEAEYSFLLGIDDNLKFKVNQRTGSDILSESLRFDFKRDEYVLKLSKVELDFCEKYKIDHGMCNDDIVVGFNTGCSLLFPNKKMTISQHIDLINMLSSYAKIKMVLIGGPEDSERNQTIYNSVGDRVINTPTNDGLRKGICYANICDVIITGDSFGMHLAIALRKHVIAWFGLSCWSEIDLYERGMKLIPEKLQCAPCWKKVCPYNLECIQQINLNKIVENVLRFSE